MGSCYPVPFKHGNNMYFMSHNRSSTLERSVITWELKHALLCPILSIFLSIYVESSSLIHRRSYP